MWIEIELAAVGADVEATATGSRGERPPPQRMGVTLDRLELFARKVSRAVERAQPLADAVVAEAGALHEALFCGEILSLASRLAEASPGGRLLLRLMLRDPALQGIPWEALCRPGTTEGFLGSSDDRLVARGVSSARAWSPREVGGAVRLLVVAPTLDEAALAALKTALAGPIASGELAWVDPVTGAAAAPRLLFERLRREPQPHVIHFLGHGGADLAGRPTLRLADDEDGEEVWIKAEALAQELSASLGEDLRLLVLESCEGARPGVFGSAAEVLARAGADAVVAHLWPVRAEAARAGSAAFYRTLTAAARGRGDVAASLAAARRTLLASSAEGFSPVLYLRGFDPVLFDFARRPSAPQASPSLPATTGAALPALPLKATPDNLPPRRLFVGRARELAQLDETLERTHKASLAALGGTGKTALALELAHRAAERGAYPGGVWWILAEGHPDTAMLKLAIALRTGAPELVAHVRPEAPAEEQAEAARIALQNHPAPSLLVLDYVSEPGFAPHLPGGGVRVLATLRERRLVLGEPVGLEPLDRDEARALAEALAGVPEGQAEAEALERVVHRDLGGLAVAVEVAAKAAKEWAGGWVAYEGYLAEQTSEAVLDDERDRSSDYPRGVFAALDGSIDRCPPGSPERALIEGAAVFAPDALPLAWAYAAAGLDARSIAGKRALATLEGLGLVEVDRAAGTLSMQRLVDKRVQGKAAPDGWREASRRGAEHVAEWIEKTAGATRAQMDEVDARRAHLEEGLAAAERVGHELAWMRMASKLAAHLKRRAVYAEAQVWSERALAKAERLDPPDPGWVAASLSNLSGIRLLLGQVAEARRLLERAIALFEKLYGPDHWQVAMALANLAGVLKQQGLAAEARPLLERALAIIEKAQGPEHSLLATLLSDLAEVLQALHLAAEAQPLLERAVALAEKTYGPDHPAVAGVLSVQALGLRDLGRSAEARPLLERALAIFEKTNDPDHPNVAVALSNLALILHDLGQAAEARPLLERALRIFEKVHSPDHLSVAVALSNLGLVLQALGQSAEARPLLERALALFEKNAGVDELRLVETLFCLAQVLQTLGQAAEARPLLERIVAVEEKAHGPDHPRTGSALANLGLLLMDLGQPAEARPLLERTLVIEEKAHGPDQPEVAVALANLAQALRALGQTAEARPLLERALALQEKSCGPSHPMVGVMLANLGAVLRDLGETAEARRLLERAMAIMEPVFPPDHPWRTSLAESLARLG
jgi:tetratricopeptide (TPR) repeat protein